MTISFAQPSASGTFLKPADLNGHLILVTEVIETFDRYDELAGKDKINARFSYVDLDGDQQLIEDAISSHPGIALRLKPNAGKGIPVLGRIGQEASKKAGFNPTWVLGEYNEGVDDKKAADWMTKHAAGKVAQPAATVAPAAATPPPAATGPKPIPESLAETMRQNGIAIPDGTPIIPG